MTNYFEHGVSSAMLYPSCYSRNDYPPETPIAANEQGVPWQGLTEIEVSDHGQQLIPFSQNGFTRDYHVMPGETKLKLKAFTYPDIVTRYENVVEAPAQPGFYVSGQGTTFGSGSFNLTYRTDAESSDGESYFIQHLVYNCTLVPEAVVNTTSAKVKTPTQFKWTIYSSPRHDTRGKIEPTSHVWFDSRTFNPFETETLTWYLYSCRILPPLGKLIDLWWA